MRKRMFGCECGGVIVFFAVAYDQETFYMLGSCPKCHTAQRMKMQDLMESILEPEVGFGKN